MRKNATVALFFPHPLSLSLSLQQFHAFFAERMAISSYFNYYFTEMQIKGAVIIDPFLVRSCEC